MGFLILLSGLMYVRFEDNSRIDKAVAAVVQSSKVVGVVNCNRDFRGRVEVLSVLKGSRRFAKRQYETHQITKDVYLTGDAFYKERLHGLPLPDCRRVLETLSSSTVGEQAIEKPLYPGSPQTKGLSNGGNGGQDPGVRPAPGGGGG